MEKQSGKLINSKGKVFLTSEIPQQGESMLYDQSLEELDLQDAEFITREEFGGAWNDR